MHEPLFKSYVFVKATEEDILSISGQINNILSLLYWMGRPATIADSEIEAIKEFSQNHSEITLEKLHVDSKKAENSPEGISFSRDGKIMMIKNRVSKVHLPSLGFTMVARTEEESILGRELVFAGEELMVKS